jgi:hypothetical protein
MDVSVFHEILNHSNEHVIQEQGFHYVSNINWILPSRINSQILCEWSFSNLILVDICEIININSRIEGYKRYQHAAKKKSGTSSWCAQ